MRTSIRIVAPYSARTVVMRLTCPEGHCEFGADRDGGARNLAPWKMSERRAAAMLAIRRPQIAALFAAFMS